MSDRITNEDALRLRGAIEFALDMSGGQANVRGLRELAEKLERLSARPAAGADAGDVTEGLLLYVEDLYSGGNPKQRENARAALRAAISDFDQRRHVSPLPTPSAVTDEPDSTRFYGLPGGGDHADVRADEIETPNEEMLRSAAERVIDGIATEGTTLTVDQCIALVAWFDVVGFPWTDWGINAAERRTKPATRRAGELE